MASRRKNARRRGEAVSCQTGISESLDEETPAPHEYAAEGRRPRPDEEDKVWRSANAAQERSCYIFVTVKQVLEDRDRQGPRIHALRVC